MLNFSEANATGWAAWPLTPQIANGYGNNSDDIMLMVLLLMLMVHMKLIMAAPRSGAMKISLGVSGPSIRSN